MVAVVVVVVVKKALLVSICCRREINKTPVRSLFTVLCNDSIEDQRSVQ
jgi:hypothetical protein